MVLVSLVIEGMQESRKKFQLQTNTILYVLRNSRVELDLAMRLLMVV